MKWLSRIKRASVAALHSGRSSQVAVNVEQFFGERVIRFHLTVSNGPGWGDSALVVNNSKILRPHAEQGSPINLGLPSDEVGLLRMQLSSVLVLPGLFRMVAVVEKTADVSQLSFSCGRNGPRSRINNFLPARASCSARVPPPAPVPIITTS